MSLSGGHGERAELDLGLTLKERFNHSDGDGCHKAVANVLHVVALAEVFLDGAGDVFLEGTLVRTALGRVLSVDEGIVFFAILRGMGEGDVNAVAREVHHGIEAGCRHVVVEEVFQTVTAHDAPSVVEYGEARVEVGVVAQHVLHELAVELVVLEEFGIGFEVDVGAVFLLCVGLYVLHKASFFKHGFVHASVAETAGREMLGEGVHGFQTYAVHTY